MDSEDYNILSTFWKITYLIMAKIEFPKPLKLLLESEESDFYAPIRGLADRVGEILADNKLPFFPDYTDHGVDHINNVLKSEVELVPKYVWEESTKGSNPRLLCDADAAVIIGATLLHDIAMHLRPEGFRELISKESRFQPLLWFKERQEGHAADRPWKELWDDYAREARRFNDRTLGNIVGLESSRLWKFQDLPEETGEWERNHFLIVGEFIRRHHARLAHEIAIYGFPGLVVGSGTNQFPAMGREEGHPLMRLADLIGLTARSHGTSLRVCQAYIDASPLYPGTPKPMGTAVLFPMGLLRVADYLQIDHKRAPAVLLQLRNPQSPISVQEWNKHLAVQNIGPATDPRGKMVTVSPSLSLELYLQLRELLAGLQLEMDHSTAVLDEAYGARADLGLNRLNLAIRRVYSNLHSPAFRDSLPYVPERTGFAADPNLLTLLVEPLYGKEPGVGVRELLQNALDAVCELDAWRVTHGKANDSLDLPQQESEVLVEFIRRDSGTWFLRVQDRGIGMRSDTIQNYFLRAGASFRQSADWAKEFIDEKGEPRVLRAGRFGVGAFAVFLLGPSFRLWTRHVTADKSKGYTLDASCDSHLIEIKRCDDLPVGTRIEVELAEASVLRLDLEAEKYQGFVGPNKRTDWFCWDWPTVTRRVLRGEVQEILRQEYTALLRRSQPGAEWSLIRPEGFDSVYWTFERAPSLVCNGLVIAEPRQIDLISRGFEWPKEVQLKAPSIAILDRAARLPVTTQRYQLSQQALPFLDELTRDVTLSFIAHALVCGPGGREGSLSSETRHPLSLGQISTYDRVNPKAPFSAGLLRWITTSREMVPTDPWLYSLLCAESCLIWGVFDFDLDSEGRRKLTPVVFDQTAALDFAMLNWDGELAFHGSSRSARVDQASKLPALILTELVLRGVAALGHELECSQVMVSASPNFRFVRDPWTSKPRRARKEAEAQEIWRRTNDINSERSRFEAEFCSITSTIPLEALLDVMEGTLNSEESRDRPHREDYLPDVIFVAELKSKAVSPSPESLIARVWNECLGPNAIPFDKVARRALIDKGRKHPELKLHIEAWEEMKQKKSEGPIANG